MQTINLFMFIESKSQVKQLSTYKRIESDSSNYSLSSRPGIGEPSMTKDVRDGGSLSIPSEDMIHVFYYDRNVQMENIVFRNIMILLPTSFEPL